MRDETHSKPSIMVSEIFFILISIQGEGKYVGVPSIFIRTYGCNFQCRAFGLDPGQRSTEREDIAGSINMDNMAYQDLPIASNGCDSYGSWHPKFKSLSTKMQLDEIVQEVNNLSTNKDAHIIITGGEPLLGWQRQYKDLFNMLLDSGYNNITFETNGTKIINKDFGEYLIAFKESHNLTFSVSPKLSNSGEPQDRAIKPDVVMDYLNYGDVFLKFVGNKDTFDEILEVTDIYRSKGFNGSIYIMPEGGNITNYNMNMREVADFALEHNYCYSPRLQVDIWENENGT